MSPLTKPETRILSYVVALDSSKDDSASLIETERFWNNGVLFLIQYLTSNGDATFAVSRKESMPASKGTLSILHNGPNTLKGASPCKGRGPCWRFGVLPSTHRNNGRGDHSIFSIPK